MLEAMVIEVCGTKASRRVTSIWNFEVELRESKVCHKTQKMKMTQTSGGGL
jgi:hypothetical protein